MNKCPFKVKELPLKLPFKRFKALKKPVHQEEWNLESDFILILKVFIFAYNNTLNIVLFLNTLFIKF